MGVRRSISNLEKKVEAEGERVLAFIHYEDRELPEDGRLWTKVDTSDESARDTPNGWRYRIGDTWHTRAELEEMGVSPRVVRFGRHVPAPDSLQP